MIVGETYYSWNPNTFRVKNPENGSYSGTAVGNASKEEQRDLVIGESTEQQRVISDVGETWMARLSVIGKYVAVAEIVETVNRAILDEFGGELGPNQFDPDGDSVITPAETEDPVPAVVPSEPEPSYIPEPILEFSGYLWNPNAFRVKHRDSTGYFGNVVGNASKEEQRDLIIGESAAQQQLIRDTGAAWMEQLSVISKYAAMADIIATVNDAIFAEFGGVFILDQSALDSGVVLA